MGNSEKSFAKRRGGSLALPFVVPISDGKDVNNHDDRRQYICHNGRDETENDVITQKSPVENRILR